MQSTPLPPYRNTCLLFTSGHLNLDVSDGSTMNQLMAQIYPFNVVMVNKSSHGYNVSMNARALGEKVFDDPEITDLGRNLSMDEVISALDRARVGCVAPSVHCTDASDVAHIANALNLYHASPAVVETLENKALYHRFMRRRRFRMPHTLSARNRSEIRRALLKIGGRCVLKPRDGYGSIGVIAVDVTDGITPEVERAIEWHLDRCRRAGYRNSLVQEFLGGPGWQEWGFMGMVERGRLVWAMTTRKLMTEFPFFKEYGHVYDPADVERIQQEKWRILPEAAAMIRELHQLQPDVPGMERSFINLDIITGPRGELCILDASARWAPVMLRLANATLGRRCDDLHFPRQAALWASGLQADITPVGPPRAAVVRKAFTEGGRLVRYQPARFGSRDAFHQEVPPEGIVLPPMRDLMSTDTTAFYPLAACDGPDLATAERKWWAATTATGLAVERDGWLHGYSETGPWSRSLN